MKWEDVVKAYPLFGVKSKKEVKEKEEVKEEEEV
jgi:hypothetical protein